MTIPDTIVIALLILIVGLEYAYDRRVKRMVEQLNSLNEQCALMVSVLREISFRLSMLPPLGTPDEDLPRSSTGAGVL